jgi:hypothetical protein
VRCAWQVNFWWTTRATSAELAPAVCDALELK